MSVLFWSSVALIGWIYIGYPALVVGLASLRRVRPPRTGPGRLRHAIVVACHNEAGRVGRRIENVRRQTTWARGGRVVIAADRCSDATADIARSYERVDVLEIREGPGGRAAAHNAAMASLDEDLVVFTDADTDFADDFLEHLLAPFSDPEVGCVIGNLRYRARGSVVAESEARYFSIEKKLREGESHLRLLATGTGACMAVRRELFRPLAPTHDVDFVTPLDVVFQGHRVVVEPRAVAYDTPPTTLKGEWHVRVRQTSRNMSGTLVRWWRARGWTRPAVTLGLFSHKVLRWLTGFFLLGALVAAWSLREAGALYRWAALVQSSAWIVGLLALALARRGVSLGALTTLGSFLWASLAMAWGSVVALTGGARVAYEAAEPDRA